jgi:hypothetical protein
MAPSVRARTVSDHPGADESDATGMATNRGNKSLSGGVNAAETRVRTVVAPYLKALRCQALPCFHPSPGPIS